MAYGSLIGGPLTIRWEDHPDYTLFNFSTSCVDSANSWAAIGLSTDQSMVKLYLHCRACIYIRKLHQGHVPIK